MASWNIPCGLMVQSRTKNEILNVIPITMNRGEGCGITWREPDEDITIQVIVVISAM